MDFATRSRFLLIRFWIFGSSRQIINKYIRILHFDTNIYYTIADSALWDQCIRLLCGFCSEFLSIVLCVTQQIFPSFNTPLIANIVEYKCIYDIYSTYMYILFAHGLIVVFCPRIVTQSVQNYRGIPAEHSFLCYRFLSTYWYSRATSREYFFSLSSRFPYFNGIVHILHGWFCRVIGCPLPPR